MRISPCSSIFSLIQPCPAPFLPVIVAAGAEAAAGAGAAADAGAAASAGKHRSKRQSKHRFPFSLLERDTVPNALKKEALSQCWLEAFQSAPQVIANNRSSITLTDLHECWTLAIEAASR